FALDVPAGADLYLEANDGAGSCPADLRADLYRAGEADPFDGDYDTGRATDVVCPLVSAVDNAGARAMPAGIYTVCIRVSEPAVVELDPRGPNVGEGHDAPPCASDEIIDINARAFHLDREYRIRVDTRNRRNLLHPDCVDRDSSEAVLRYTVPAVGTDTPRVRA